MAVDKPNVIDALCVHRASGYLARLVHGIESHPDQRVRAIVLNEYLEDFDIERLKRSLPEPYRNLVVSPLKPSLYLSAVHYYAFVLAVADVLLLQEPRFIELFAAACERLLARQWPRLLPGKPQPTAEARRLCKRWRELYRGTELVASFDSAHNVLLTMRYADKLLPPLCARAWAVAFERLFVGTRAGQIDFSLKAHGPTEAVFIGHVRR
jgi:hypothetical protein